MGGRPQDTEDVVRYGAPIHRDEQPDECGALMATGMDYRDGRMTSGHGSSANWKDNVFSYIEFGDVDEPTGIPFSGFWPLFDSIIEKSRPFIRPRESVFLNRHLMGFGMANAANPNLGGEAGKSSEHPPHRNDAPPSPFPGGWERVAQWPRARTRYKVLGE